MTRILLLCLTVLTVALSVLSQTITTTDQSGNTIVEVITIDPIQGLPVTQIIETLPPAVATTPPTSSPSLTTPALPTLPTTPSIIVVPTTPPAGQQGPVGAPVTQNGPAGPVVYTYTTTDANGATIAVVDTFTPTGPLSTPFTPTSTGTILDYSSWLQSVGTNTVGAVNFSGSSRLSVPTQDIGAAVALVAGLLGAMRLVLL